MPSHYNGNNNQMVTNLHTSGGEYVCSDNSYPGCGTGVGGTYVGSMHYHPDKGYMAGAQHSEQSHPLLERVNGNGRNNMPGHYGNGNGNGNNGQMNGRNTRRMTGRRQRPNGNGNPNGANQTQMNPRTRTATSMRGQSVTNQMNTRRMMSNTTQHHHTGYEYYDDGTPYTGNINELINFNGIYYTSTNGVRTTDSRMVVHSNEPGLGVMRPPTAGNGIVTAGNNQIMGNNGSERQTQPRQQTRTRPTMNRRNTSGGSGGGY
jgi:hypothetical protein